MSRPVPEDKKCRIGEVTALNSGLPLQFGDTVPDAHKDDIVDALNRWSCLIPEWCHNGLFVGYDGERTDELAYVVVQYDYRVARIWLSRLLFNEKPENLAAELDSVLRHELCHILLAPLEQYCCRTIERFVTNETIRGHILAEHAERVESVTSDFCQIAKRWR